MPTSTATRTPNAAEATVPSVMTMISAERMKSVRTAPLILSFSTVRRSTAGSTMASRNSWRCKSSSLRWTSACQIFSNPSKHRNRPPAISSGTIAHGAIALMASAAGTRIALLTSEPLATAQTTGSSRFDLTPATCCAFSARSSPSTPAVFFVAALVSTETSSRMLAMSSRRASRLAPAMESLGLAGKVPSYGSLQVTATACVFHRTDRPGADAQGH